MSKYKIYHKIIKPISYSEFPSVRLVKFKRSKWKRLKSKILKKKSSLRRLFYKVRFLKRKKYIKKAKNFKLKKIKRFRSGMLSFYKKFNSFEKVKKAYKNGLLQKNSMRQFFGSTLTLKYLKGLALLKKNVFYEFYIKPFFKLDILLWKLKFFYSIKEAQQHIRSKNVLVNGVTVNSYNFFLSKGDVVKILNKNINVFNRGGLNTSFILSFCDVDFYSYKIILLKNISDLTVNDFGLDFNYFTGLRSYIYYLKKK